MLPATGHVVTADNINGGRVIQTCTIIANLPQETSRATETSSGYGPTNVQALPVQEPSLVKAAIELLASSQKKGKEAERKVGQKDAPQEGRSGQGGDGHPAQTYHEHLILQQRSAFSMHVAKAWSRYV